MSSNKNQGCGGRPLAPQHGGIRQPFYTNNSYLSSSSSDNLGSSINGYNPYSSVNPASAEDIFIVEGGIRKCNEGQKETGIKATAQTVMSTEIVYDNNIFYIKDVSSFLSKKLMKWEKQLQMYREVSLVVLLEGDGVKNNG